MNHGGPDLLYNCQIKAGLRRATWFGWHRQVGRKQAPALSAPPVPCLYPLPRAGTGVPFPLPDRFPPKHPGREPQAAKFPCLARSPCSQRFAVTNASAGRGPRARGPALLQNRWLGRGFQGSGCRRERSRVFAADLNVTKVHLSTRHQASALPHGEQYFLTLLPDHSGDI